MVIDGRMKPFVRRSCEIRERLVRIISAGIENSYFHLPSITQVGATPRKPSGCLFLALGEFVDIPSLALGGAACACGAKARRKQVHFAAPLILLRRGEIFHGRLR